MRKLLLVIGFFGTLPTLGSAQWTQCLPGSGEGGNFVQFGENLFSYSNDHLHLSTDYGETWVIRSNNHGPNVAFGRYLLGLDIDSGIIRSSDSGSTWTTVKRGQFANPSSGYSRFLSVIDS